MRVDDLAVIDVGALVSGVPDPAGLKATAAAIDRACRDTGFFLVAGHGVAGTALVDLDAAAREFFARPEAEKAGIAMARGGRAWRGWFPEGGELTAVDPTARRASTSAPSCPTTTRPARSGTTRTSTAMERSRSSAA